MPTFTATSVSIINNTRYVTVVSNLGSVGVSKWELSRCTYPIIRSVSIDGIKLDDGVTLPLPVADWIDNTIFYWGETARSM